MSPANIDRFLVVLDCSHVKGRKLKVVKKKPFLPPSYATPMRRPRQIEGDTPTSCPTEDVEGVTVDVDLYRNRASGVEQISGREVSNTPTLPPVSPRLDELDGLMDQAFVDLAIAFDVELPTTAFSLPSCFYT